MQLFGFEIKRKSEEDLKSFVEKQEDDGAVNVSSTGVTGAMGTFVDLEGTAKSEAELITRYRSMISHPEVSRAVDDIVNESIVISDNNKVVEINLDDTELSNNIKKRVQEEFDEVLKLLDFSNKGYDTFQKWYVDGRLKYHVIIDEKNIKSGIKELRYIDPRKLRKIREKQKKKDPNSDAVLTQVKNEYYIFNDNGFNNTKNNATAMDATAKGIQIAKDSIIEVTSGILNENNSLVLSHLHKAIKALNQLKMLEDAAVIYRLARAPERRIFYVDVGNLPKVKAEQYLRDMMVKHKNRLVYDASTGEVRDDRKHMTMLEDFWMARRNGERGTEITTLPGGANLGEIEDILYFQKNLYKALNVPISRMEADTGFSLGRASEISRDEIKFNKFIQRLRARFSLLFDDILEKQLVLKNVMTIEEWYDIKDSVRYDFMKDNHYEELKEQEILIQRLQTLDAISQHVGEYYSKKWIQKNILQFSDEDIEDMQKEIEEEGSDVEDDQDSDQQEAQNTEPTPVKIVK